MNKDQLVAALFEAVHPNGENGHGKTTAYGLRSFLSTLIDELVARPVGGTGTGGTGTGTGSPGGPSTVLTAPNGLTYRLTVADDGTLHAELADGLPRDPSAVLTAPNGLTYRLTVADDGTLRALPTTGPVDPAATAFIAAAGLTNEVHQEAINQLVIALKISNVWPRLRALYPVVGGTARAHALNLLDPRDDDAAFRLTFVNNPRHDALGVRWDGATQYADTHFVPAAQLPLNSCHLAYYATTTSGPNPSHVEIGSIEGNRSLSLVCNFDGGIFQVETPGSYARASVPTTLGLSLGSQVDGHTLANYRDGQALPLSYLSVQANTPHPNAPLQLAHRQDGFYSDRACGLASVGEGLSAAEAQAYAAAVADFQRALGRAVALPPEAVAFATAAGLTEPAQVQAVGTLVNSLKDSGVWPLLRACYPMVGGTERAHALNLKDPRDADTAFRLTFVNAPVHTARGVEWNAGSSTYANTHLVPREHIDPADNHLAYYAVTDSSAGIQIEMGCADNGSLSLLMRHSDVANGMYVEDCGSPQYSAPLAHGLGLGLLSRISLADLALYRDGQRLELRGFTNGNVDRPTAPLWLAGRQDGHFSQKTCGLASIGRGLTPVQAQAYAAAVAAFQRALGRDVALAPELLLA